jgi:hypothetical protein
VDRPYWLKTGDCLAYQLHLAEPRRTLYAGWRARSVPDRPGRALVPPGLHAYLASTPHYLTLRDAIIDRWADHGTTRPQAGPASSTSTAADGLDENSSTGEDRVAGLVDGPDVPREQRSTGERSGDRVSECDGQR